MPDGPPPVWIWLKMSVDVDAAAAAAAAAEQLDEHDDDDADDAAADGHPLAAHRPPVLEVAAEPAAAVPELDHAARYAP